MVAAEGTSGFVRSWLLCEFEGPSAYPWLRPAWYCLSKQITPGSKRVRRFRPLDGHRTCAKGRNSQPFARRESNIVGGRKVR